MEERLLKSLIHDVLEEVLFKTLCVSHLTEDLTVSAHDTLDAIIRTVRVVWRLHSDILLKRINILEGHLTVCKELTCKLFVDNELTLTVADSNRMKVTYSKTCKPWRICSRDTGSHHL